MKLPNAKVVGAIALMAQAAMPSRGESINPPTKPQVAPMTAQEKKNLDFVLQWWREVLYARHVELAPKYQAVSYIEHDPNISTTRAEFVAFVSKGKQINPIPATMPDMPVVTGARGDFVWLVFEAEAKHPVDASKTYLHNTFNVFRLENGKIQEHWDSHDRRPTSPAVQYGVSPKPPSGWNTGKLSAEEEKTLAMATEELKDMLQYGHLELADKTMDPGYIQHNPLVPQGRDGFKQFMSKVPGRVPQEMKPEWKNPPVLTLINGPYSFMMWERTAKDPTDPGKEYVWNHFDVLRVENGLIKEHWDESIINPPRQGK
jgi:predicted SnoaL-like aldol condensation-catalyzing enzyme